MSTTSPLPAFAYLYATSLRNNLLARLKRLKQPKYAVGALLGVAYFYFIVFHQLRAGSAATLNLLTGAVSEGLILAASLMLLVASVFAWIFPSGRATLRFSEAEIAFFLPAPISRKALIHAKLLRAQLGILFTVLVLSLLFRRGGSFDVAVYRGVGWWMILSTVQLHFLAVSFARERLLGVGVGAWLRRGLVLVLLFALYAAIRNFGGLPSPEPAELTGGKAFIGYLLRVTGEPNALTTLLAPFRWVVLPYFTRDFVTFAYALLPAAGVLLVHYLWVVRADVAFEEASIGEAAKQARRIEALRRGNLRLGDRPLKPRGQPFALQAKGSQAVAYLWKGLIELGPLYRLRTLVVLCLFSAIGVHWLALDPAREVFLRIVAISCIALGAMTYAFGPMFVVRGAHELLERLDVTRSYPSAGRQILLGQLLPTLVMMCSIQAWLLFTAILAYAEIGRAPGELAQFGLAGGFAIALLTPPLIGVLLCVPLAGALYFPAWSQSLNQRGGGIEAGGQRLLYFLVYFLSLALTLVAPAIVLLVLFWPLHFLLPGSVALLIGALAAAGVLFGEFVAVLHWLGGKLERFDLSVEMPR